MVKDKMIKIKIDGIEGEVPSASTILEAAELLGIEIPTLCYMKEYVSGGNCRMCTVELGSGKLVTACTEPCREGLEVLTMSEKVVEARRFVLDLMLSKHLMSCFSCERSGECKDRMIPFCNYDKNCFTCGISDRCEFRSLCFEYGVEATSFPVKIEEQPIRTVNDYFEYNPNRCIMCRRCQVACENSEGKGIIAILGRSFDTHLEFPDKMIWDEKVCLNCGKCFEVCINESLKKKES